MENYNNCNNYNNYNDKPRLNRPNILHVILKQMPRLQLQSQSSLVEKTHKKININNIKMNKEQEKAEDDNNVVAILDSGPSFDAYRELYRKAKNKSVEEVIKNYKKYFNEGSSGKRIFC